MKKWKEIDNHNTRNFITCQSQGVEVYPLMVQRVTDSTTRTVVLHHILPHVWSWSRTPRIFAYRKAIRSSDQNALCHAYSTQHTQPQVKQSGNKKNLKIQRIHCVKWCMAWERVTLKPKLAISALWKRSSTHSGDTRTHTERQRQR